MDDQTTGVLAATMGPLAIRVAGNVVTSDHFGIWITGPVTAAGSNDNIFADVTVPVAHG